jgi:hypothetical protein
VNDENENVKKKWLKSEWVCVKLIKGQVWGYFSDMWKVYVDEMEVGNGVLLLVGSLISLF